MLDLALKSILYMNFYEKCLQYVRSSKVNETVYSMFQQERFHCICFCNFRGCKVTGKTHIDLFYSTNDGLVHFYD